MIENDAIRTQVANTPVDSLGAKCRRGGGYRGPTASGTERVGPRSGGSVRSGADRAAEAALERPRVQKGLFTCLKEAFNKRRVIAVLNTPLRHRRPDQRIPRQ
jgi:hypothetical protein